MSDVSLLSGGEADFDGIREGRLTDASVSISDIGHIDDQLPKLLSQPARVVDFAGAGATR